MSYSQPRDRLELRLKEIIDNEIGDVTDRRTRFDTLLAAVVDPSVVPPDQRDRAELYLSELAGRAGGGITPTGTVTITANGTHDVEQYKYAQVAVPAPTPQTEALSITIGSVGNQIITYYPGYGKTYSDVTLYRDDNVIAPGNIKKDVVIFGVTGTYDAGGILRYDSRQLACTGSHTVTLGWRPEHIIVSYVWHDPDYNPEDPEHDAYLVDYHLDLNQTTDITGEGDYVTFTSTGYTFVSVGTGFNDYPEDYSKLTFTAMAV